MGRPFDEEADAAMRDAVEEQIERESLALFMTGPGVRRRRSSTRATPAPCWACACRRSHNRPIAGHRAATACSGCDAMINRCAHRQPRRDRPADHPHLPRLGIATVAVLLRRRRRRAVRRARPTSPCACRATRRPRRTCAPSRSSPRLGAAGADAVHPGYGFLAENAGFARAVIDAGLTWVGPPPAAIAAMGSKIEAKALMREGRRAGAAGHWTRSRRVDARSASRAGQGVGRRRRPGDAGRRATPAELDEAVAAARREARAAFGDGTVFVERYVEGGRGTSRSRCSRDAHGTVVALFERDCSMQRRHQKIVEEAPSPAVDAALRAAMCDAAVAAGPRGRLRRRRHRRVPARRRTAQFFFLEMNTRLQVEHPVTEVVTGLDLVALQLRVAAGEPLPHAAPRRSAATPSRCGSTPRTRRTTSSRRPGTLHRVRPADPGTCGSTAAWSTATGRRRTTTRCSPRSIAHGADPRRGRRPGRRAGRRADPRPDHQPRPAGPHPALGRVLAGRVAHRLPGASIPSCARRWPGRPRSGRRPWSPRWPRPRGAGPRRRC